MQGRHPGDRSHQRSAFDDNPAEDFPGEIAALVDAGWLESSPVALWLMPRSIFYGETIAGLLAWLTSSAGFLRWAYRGHRANWIARVLNRASAAAASAGVAPNLLVTLEVTGRKSGRIVALPLVVVTVGGQRYFVSMLGDDVQWVRNVRAASGRAALLNGGREQVRLDESIPADQRAAIG